MLGVAERQIKEGKEFKEAVKRKRVELLPEIFTTNHTNDTNESGEEPEWALNYVAEFPTAAVGGSSLFV